MTWRGEFVAVAGSSLYLARTRATRSDRVVLVLPAFGEEMNKSRRMVTLAARSLAAHGVGVLAPDLSGTGDSSGEFAESRWEQWIAELTGVIDIARAEGFESIKGLAVRAGALFIPDLLASGIPLSGVALWEPVISGASFVTQLLRIRLAAGMAASGKDRETMQTLRAAIESGDVLDVAGYPLPAALLQSLGAKSLSLGGSHPLPIAWFNVVHDIANGTPRAAAEQIRELIGVGHRVSAAAVSGAAFWHSVEIETVPELIDRSVSWLCEA